MSARYLPRELGVVVTCSVDGCTERHQTANVYIDVNRADAKRLGWCRGGGLPGKRRLDFCPTHAPAHQLEVAQYKQDKAARIEARREAKKLLLASKAERKAAADARRAAREATKAARAAEQGASA